MWSAAHMTEDKADVSLFKYVTLNTSRLSNYLVVKTKQKHALDKFIVITEQFHCLQQILMLKRWFYFLGYQEEKQSKTDLKSRCSLRISMKWRQFFGSCVFLEKWIWITLQLIHLWDGQTITGLKKGCYHFGFAPGKVEVKDS